MVLIAFFVLSTATLVALYVYYVMNPRQIVGDQLVNTANHQPFEIPPPGTFPYYVKPITILFVAGVVFVYTFFALTQGYMAKYLPRWVIRFFLLVSVLVLAMAIYEVLLNFTLWGALLTTPGASPNLLTNSHPISSNQINLVYATKVSLLYCVGSFIGILGFSNALKIKSDQAAGRISN